MVPATHWVKRDGEPFWHLSRLQTTCEVVDEAKRVFHIASRKSRLILNDFRRPSGPRVAPIDSSSGLGVVSRAGTLQAYDSLFKCRSNDDVAPVVLPLLGNPHFPVACGVFGWAAHEPRRKVSFRREKQPQDFRFRQGSQGSRRSNKIGR